MVEILQEKRKPSFGQQLAQGLNQGIYEASQGIPKLMGERLKFPNLFRLGSTPDVAIS